MKIEVLFPEIANLYGDLENISYLKRSCPEIEVVETHLVDEPLFVSEKPDLIYMGTMTESAQILVVEKLSQYKDSLKARIDDGTLFLITGNALEVFGDRIEDKDGTVVKCLGMFPSVAKRNMMNRFNSLYLGTFKDMTLAGYKSQFTHSYKLEKTDIYTATDTDAVEKNCMYDDFDEAWISDRGPGLNPDTNKEGIKKNNFIATYVIGPITVLNPPFAKWILNKMGIKEPKLAYEEAAMEAYEVRVKEYSNPETGFYY